MSLLNLREEVCKNCNHYHTTPLPKFTLKPLSSMNSNSSFRTLKPSAPQSNAVTRSIKRHSAIPRRSKGIYSAGSQAPIASNVGDAVVGGSRKPEQSFCASLSLAHERYEALATRNKRNRLCTWVLTSGQGVARGRRFSAPRIAIPGSPPADCGGARQYLKATRGRGSRGRFCLDRDVEQNRRSCPLSVEGQSLLGL